MFEGTAVQSSSAQTREMSCLREYHYLILVCMLCSLQLSPILGSFESQCVQEGGKAVFHCPDEAEWSINEIPLDNDTPGIVSFTTSNTTNTRDYMTINATSDFVDLFRNDSIIKCLDEHNKHFYAMLLVVQESDMELFPTLMPMSWTNLTLVWTPPACHNICYSSQYVDYNFIVTLQLENGDTSILSMPHNGNESVYIDLEGYECMKFNINISLPGNCKPASIAGALLINPEYPKPSQIVTILLNYTSIAVTWSHPDSLFNDEVFDYMIIAEDSSGAVITAYNTSITIHTTPYEVFNMTGRQCSEITFSVSLLNDCRAITTTIGIPIDPGHFSSAEIKVESQYSANLQLNKIEVSFMMPEICEFQVINYSVVFRETSSSRSWEAISNKPMRGGQSVREDVNELEWFKLDNVYIVTVTLFTQFGNISSSMQFGLDTPFGGVVSQLKVVALSHNNAILSWNREWNTEFETSLTVTYLINASLMGSGQSAGLWTLPVAGNQTPSLSLHMETYACQPMMYSITLFGKQAILASITYTLPSYPQSFQKNISAEPSFNRDGSFKEIQIEFKPPKLCDFQSSSYVLSYSGGGETWSNEPVNILDTSLVIKEEIKSHLLAYTEYNITISITTDYDDVISSHTTVKYTDSMLSIGNLSHSDSGNQRVYYTVGVVLGVILISIAGIIVVIVCFIYVKKRRERKILDFTARVRANAMVPNPIYDGNDDHYEQLPDCRGRPPPSFPLSAPPPSKSSTNPLFTPALPPPRDALCSSLPTAGKLKEELIFPESQSLGVMSNYSGEDCYTVMNSAGNVTILPRISIISPPPPLSIIVNDREVPMMISNDGKCIDDDNVSV